MLTRWLGRASLASLASPARGTARSAAALTSQVIQVTLSRLWLSACSAARCRDWLGRLGTASLAGA